MAVALVQDSRRCFLYHHTSELKLKRLQNDASQVYCIFCMNRDIPAHFLPLVRKPITIHACAQRNHLNATQLLQLLKTTFAAATPRLPMHIISVYPTDFIAVVPVEGSVEQPRPELRPQHLQPALPQRRPLLPRLHVSQMSTRHESILGISRSQGPCTTCPRSVPCKRLAD